jgi:small-conductance mechanosensitive channel
MVFKILLIVCSYTLSLFANNFMDSSLITINETSITLTFLFKFTVVLAVGLSLAWFYKYKIIKSDRLSDKLSNPAKILFGNLGYYFIVFITIVTALNSVGLNLSSLAVVAGALSVGIGFGLQNIVSNFISGIILMFDRSIKIDDFIELENGLRGTVRDIRLRATIITTNENIDIIIPNSDFIQNPVTNLTLNDEMLRFRIPFGVAYGTTVKQLENTVLKEILQDDELPHKKDNPSKIPRIWMTGMGSSSVDFELVFWVEGKQAQKRRTINSIYLMKIYEILNENNIIIPFPQLDVHIQKEFN